MKAENASVRLANALQNFLMPNRKWKSVEFGSYNLKQASTGLKTRYKIIKKIKKIFFLLKKLKKKLQILTKI